MAEYRDTTHASGDEAAQAPGVRAIRRHRRYSPVAYAPYIIAAAVGRLLGLDLPELLFLMRFVGLVVFTAVTAYAIAVAPALKWAFVLIAMLPVSLYNRVVLSADGAALSYALVITALCFRAAWNPLRRAGLGALAMDDAVRTRQAAADCLRPVGVDGRPSQGTAATLEQPCDRRAAGRYPVAAMGGGSVGRRRGVACQGGTINDPPEQFDPLWKLSYMWEHPLHFPLAAWTALSEWGAPLWPELIGILGWQDILLRPWTYLVLTVLLLLVPLQKVPLDGATRARVAVMTGLAALSYIVMVYLIFFPHLHACRFAHVLGVQGRYFVIALPMAAIFMASLINLELPRGMPPLIGIAGSMIAGITTGDAVLQAHW